MMISLTMYLLWTLASAGADPPAPPTAADPASTAKVIARSDSPASAALEPYRVRAWIDFEPHPIFSPAVIRHIRADAIDHVHQILGKAWTIEWVDPPPSARAHLPNPPMAPGTPAPDKLLVARWRFDYSTGSIHLRTNEFDTRSETWGPDRFSRLDPDLPLGPALLRDWLAIFRPHAEIVGKTRGRAEVSVRGSALVSRIADFRWAPPGRVLIIYRQRADGSDRPTLVPWSYLIVPSESVEKTQPRLVEPVEVASLLRDPLTGRSRQRMKYWALALPAEFPAETRITFRTRPDDRPIAGYEVAMKPWGEPSLYTVGATDHRGELTVRFPQGVSAGKSKVAEILLLSGSTVLARFPLVPGAPKELLAQASVDPLLAEISGAMLSIQEEIVDQAARRKIVEIRLKKAAGANDLEKTQALADQINGMPHRPVFQQRVDLLRENVIARSKELKQSRLSSHVNRLFLQTERLLQSVPADKLVIETTTEPAP
jgi:hypothetical protein